jgi:hypothetical protein
MAQQAQQQQMQMQRNLQQFQHAGANPSGWQHQLKATRMTQDDIHNILRLHSQMLRDAAATDVYYMMLLAKQGARAANLVDGRRHDPSRSLKLSDALEGALGKPAPRDLRRPRQLMTIQKATDEEAEGESAEKKGEGASGAAAEEDADKEAELKGVPSTVSALPRAVRYAIEDAMLRLLALQDLDKILVPDPPTRARKETLVSQLYGMLRVTPAPEAGKALLFTAVGADMAAMQACAWETDSFFKTLLLVPKGTKTVLRALRFLSPAQCADVLSHLVRCLLPLAYYSATRKDATPIELLVQLLVKLVYSLDITSLTGVLQRLKQSFSDPGLHLLACTKLGALALAALLRRGHDEYMTDEQSRTPEAAESLLKWAGECHSLIRRLSAGLDALFMASTQGSVTAFPAAMITDAEVMVDLLYELGANANEEQRTNICRELAASASRTGSPQVQEQVTQLLTSLNWSA